MATLKLSAPWVVFYREVQAMFKEDNDIHVVYDEDNMALKLYVENGYKAAALEKLLPTEKKFGDIVLKIEVIPANNSAEENFLKFRTVQSVDTDLADIFRDAFDRNPILDYVHVVNGVFGFSGCYVVFAKKVIQFFTDDLGDMYGNCSTLAQNIAKDIFVDLAGVFYCTNVDNRVKNAAVHSGRYPYNKSNYSPYTNEEKF